MAAPPENGDLLFFRTTENMALVQGHPERYETLGNSDTSPRRYVEREPAVRVTRAEIEWVSIERTADVSEEVQRELERRLGRRPTNREGIFMTTVALSEAAARRVNQFVSSQAGRLIDIRFGRYRLATPTVIGSFEGSTFAVLLAETDEERIRKTFSPLDNKVLWKK